MLEELHFLLKLEAILHSFLSPPRGRYFDVDQTSSKVKQPEVATVLPSYTSATEYSIMKETRKVRRGPIENGHKGNLHGNNVSEHEYHAYKCVKDRCIRRISRSPFPRNYSGPVIKSPINKDGTSLHCIHPTTIQMWNDDAFADASDHAKYLIQDRGVHAYPGTRCRHTRSP